MLPTPIYDILFFDTETNGLPKDYRAPLSRLDNWPRLVQLAWARYDGLGNPIFSSNLLIKPVGFEIPETATAIHGITQERAWRDGTELVHALASFEAQVKAAGLVVAHNLEYDVNVTSAEMMRLGWTPPFISKPSVDTMKVSTEYCKLPGKYGYKCPKLAELYFILFREQLAGGHDALVDLQATARCFFELERLGVINVLGRKESTINEDPFPDIKGL